MLGPTQLATVFSSAKPHCLLQATLRATICHKSELEPKNVYHWPYEKRAWNSLTCLADPFTKRKFDENSKIIVVEGNINAGKEDFAKRLADELGMKYAPPIDLERHFYTDYGYDYRALNPLLPERLRICDWKMWHENPSRHSLIHMQDILFKLRLAQYIKALQHLFNTGQGVVLNRSVFTELVFVEAMHKVGWLPMGYLRGDGVRFYDWRFRYNYVRDRALTEIAKPHLAIYLERPVDQCIERIKNSSDPMEANSKAHIPELLEAIQEAYEDVMLPRLEHNGHVLSYKVENEMTHDDILDVVDDIKGLNFDYDWHDTRFEDWDDKLHKLWYRKQRMKYTTTYIGEFFLALNQSWYDIAGMGDCITETDLRMKHVLYESQVTPVGYHNDYDTDIEQQGFLKSLLDYSSFGKKFDTFVRSDYV